MQFSFTRMVIPVIGITFGFFISCSTTNTTTSQQPVEPEELTVEQIETELRSIDKQIENEQENADLFYQKGFLLNEYAKSIEAPAQRNATYQEMHETLKEADRQFTMTDLPSGNQKVDELLKIAWSNEHNQGVQIMQSDSTLESNDYETAALHFRNATAILPDTAISYKMEARAYYQNHDIEKAISILEKANRNIDILPNEMLEQLAFLYLENEQPRNAISVFEQAKSFSNENLNVLHGLANAYISADEHDKAVSLLEQLVEDEPQNIIYSRALATEYYHLGSEKLKELADNPPRSVDMENELVEADSLLDKAEEFYRVALSNSNGLEEVTLTAAQFYQNAAARYQKVLSKISDNDEQLQTEVEEKIENYLNASIPLYQKLVQNSPQASKWWNNLYQVYTYLGMSEEAEEAKSKIN